MSIFQKFTVYKRSDLTIPDMLKSNNFRTEVGHGVYDIHSPRVPSKEEIRTAINKMRERIPAEKLWVNPDCGLKTRGNAETIPSLQNLVDAAKEARHPSLYHEQCLRCPPDL